MTVAKSDGVLLAKGVVLVIGGRLFEDNFILLLGSVYKAHNCIGT